MEIPQIQSRPIAALYASGLDADVAAWVAAVSAVSSVSPSTIRAVNRAVKRAKKSGLWAKIVMLDLCAGDTLAGALVRVKVPAGVNRSYTNHNFVAGDYEERGANGGLKGNGSSKYLDSGINPVSLGLSLSSFGLWVYTRETVTGANTRSSFGSGVSGYFSMLGWVSGGTRESGGIGAIGGAEYPAGSNVSLAGFLGVLTNGSRSQQFYADGVAVGLPATSSGSFQDSRMFKFVTGDSNFPSGNYSQRRLSSTVVTLGLDAPEIAELVSIITEFEEALDRDV